MSHTMEHSLDMRLGDVLPIIQESIIKQTRYFGVQTLKSPMDAWLYQEMIYDMKPDVILEIGNAYGGSALMLAHWCDLLGKGRVIGVDISHHQVAPVVRSHPRITLIEGDAAAIAPKVKAIIKPGERVLVIEDSSHTYENTLAVLEAYADLVAVGDYFIVEDSICHHGLDVGPNPGPYEAIEAFVARRPEFEIDRSRERFLITWNPKGYLRRRG